MDVEHRRPFFGRHLERGLVAQDAGVVDQDVEAAERLHRGADDLFGGGEGADRPLVRDRLAAGAPDLLDHAVGGVALAAAVASAARVVDYYSCALLGEEQSVGATDAGAGAGDEDDLAVEESHLTSWRIGRPADAAQRRRIA